MKNIIARATLISLLIGLSLVTKGQADDYYIYQTLNGGLVISNKEPPPGSKIIKQLSEKTDSEVQQGLPRNNPQQHGQAESSPKPTKSKISAGLGPSMRISITYLGLSLPRARFGSYTRSPWRSAQTGLEAMRLGL